MRERPKRPCMREQRTFCGVPCLDDRASVSVSVPPIQPLELRPDVVVDMLGIEVNKVRAIETAHIDGLSTTIGEAARYPALAPVNALAPKDDFEHRVDSRLGWVEHERVLATRCRQLGDEGRVSRRERKLIPLLLPIAVNAGEKEILPGPCKPSVRGLRPIVLDISILGLLLALLAVAAFVMLHLCEIGLDEIVLPKLDFLALRRRVARVT